MEKREYTCIVCPKSCKGTLSIADDGGMITEGFDCKNGKQYAQDEYTAPKRMLTTTVAIENAVFNLLPVVGSGEIRRSQIPECLDYLYQISVQAPVKAGEILVKDICGSGVDILAARSLSTK